MQWSNHGPVDCFPVNDEIVASRVIRFRRQVLQPFKPEDSIRVVAEPATDAGGYGNLCPLKEPPELTRRGLWAFASSCFSCRHKSQSNWSLEALLSSLVSKPPPQQEHPPKTSTAAQCPPRKEYQVVSVSAASRTET